MSNDIGGADKPGPADHGDESPVDRSGNGRGFGGDSAANALIAEPSLRGIGKELREERAEAASNAALATLFGFFEGKFGPENLKLHAASKRTNLSSAEGPISYRTIFEVTPSGSDASVYLAVVNKVERRELGGESALPLEVDDAKVSWIPNVDRPKRGREVGSVTELTTAIRSHLRKGWTSS